VTDIGEEEHTHGTFKGWVRRNFLTGILVLVPILGTAFLFTWGIGKITNRGLEVLKGWAYFAELYEGHQRTYDIIGRLTVILGLIGVVSLVGFLARNLIGRRVVRLMEKVIENIPLINRIFLALKQISHAVIGSNRSLFSYVILFEYPRRGIYSIGFVMSESRGEVQERTKEDLLSIFLPTTPNPTSGMFILVPKEDCMRLSMSVEDALKMVISGGAIIPEYKRGQLLSQYGDPAGQGAIPPGGAGATEEENPAARGDSPSKAVD
jgi:uncharacterized membrane protein